MVWLVPMWREDWLQGLNNFQENKQCNSKWGADSSTTLHHRPLPSSSTPLKCYVSFQQLINSSYFVLYGLPHKNLYFHWTDFLPKKVAFNPKWISTVGWSFSFLLYRYYSEGSPSLSTKTKMLLVISSINFCMNSKLQKRKCSGPNYWTLVVWVVRPM